MGLAAFVSGREELPSPVRLRLARDVLDGLRTPAPVAERSVESVLRFDRVRVHAEGLARVGGGGDESGAARILWEILASRAGPDALRPPRLHHVVDEIPPDVDEVVERALSGHYETVDELREAFDEASRGLVASREEVRQAFGFVDLDPTPPLARADVPLSVRARELAETLDRIADALWPSEPEAGAPADAEARAGAAEASRPLPSLPPSSPPREAGPPVVRVVGRAGKGALGGALVAEGYRVEAIGSAAEAAASGGEAPACVVVDAGEAGAFEEATLVFVRRLRTGGAGAPRTPLLVVTAPGEEEALAAFLVGADVCLRRPVDVETVVLQVGALVRMARRLAPFEGPGEAASRAVEGDLSQISLATVLSVLDMERQSGVFEARRGPEVVRIEVEGGGAPRAFFGAARVAPLDALRRALAWAAGRFSFTPAAPASAVVAQGAHLSLASVPTLGELLMEAARLRDEARSLDVEPGGVEG